MDLGRPRDASDEGFDNWWNEQEKPLKPQEIWQEARRPLIALLGNTRLLLNDAQNTIKLHEMMEKERLDCIQKLEQENTLLREKLGILKKSLDDLFP